MEDKVGVVFYLVDDGAERKRICGFHTNNFAEWIKCLHYCKKHDIDFYPRETDENISQDIIQKAAGIGFLIEDFYVHFGSDECVQLIEVYLK